LLKKTQYKPSAALYCIVLYCIVLYCNEHFAKRILVHIKLQKCTTNEMNIRAEILQCKGCGLVEWVWRIALSQWAMTHIVLESSCGFVRTRRNIDPLGIQSRTFI